MDIIRFKRGFDPNGDRCILVKETPVPELVPGYPEGPAYDFFFVDLKGFFWEKGRGENGNMKKLDKDELHALYKHIEGRKDRIFVWHYLKGFREDGAEEVA